MAYMRIVRPQAAVDIETYDAINGELEVETRHPVGLIMHAAGEMDGAWQIVEVWESEEYARRFDAERLEPAIEAVTGPPALLRAADGQLGAAPADHALGVRRGPSGPAGAILGGRCPRRTWRR